MKIWLACLTAVCLVNFWCIGNLYERIAVLTLAVEEQVEVINAHADIINTDYREALIAHQTAIELQGEKINELIDYLEGR